LGTDQRYHHKVLCNSTESEMHEFRSLSLRTFKEMRAKCANFVLCLCELSSKVRMKIQASFCNVLSVISLKQRTKIRSIFKTRTTIPYQRDNSACSMRNIAVQCADQYQAINVSFSCEQSRSRWRFTPL